MKINLDRQHLTELLIPLYLISLDKKQFRGRTRLQKLVFLAQQRSKNAVEYDFEPASWGPLSFKLYNHIETLEYLGMIKEIHSLTSSGNDLVCYQITDQGMSFLSLGSKNKTFSFSLRRTVDEVYNEFGSKPFLQLLDFVHKKYPQYVKRNPVLGFS